MPDMWHEAAKDLCFKDCRALVCEQAGHCRCPYPGPGYSWFEETFIAEAMMKHRKALAFWAGP